MMKHTDLTPYHYMSLIFAFKESSEAKNVVEHFTGFDVSGLPTGNNRSTCLRLFNLFRSLIINSSAKMYIF